MKLQDRTAIVTGGARGIGLACARAFVDEGAKVMICDVNDDTGAAAANRKKSPVRRCSWPATIPAT